MAGDDTNSPLNIFKKVYSTGLLIFSIIIIMGLIFNEQTKLAQDVHPGLAFVTCWVAIIWLTMVEGGQASLVGLTPIDEDLYKDSHQTSLKSTSITNKGDNLDRYLLGRQLMVVVVVFTVNISAAPIADATLWGFSDTTINIFLGSGLAMILFVCMVGQLNSQVNASHCMLDYINNYFAVFTTWTCMAIEFSGVVHFSYVLQFIVAAIAGKPIESKEGEKDAAQKLFFWARCLFSFVLLAFSFAVTLVALFDGKTTMWGSVPPAAAVIVFFLLMSVIGLLEGMQIAFFAVAKLRKEERGSAKFAKMTCELLFKGKGMNLPGFMIGRQLCVVSCMFFVARVTSLEIEEGESNVFGVSDGFQEFLNTGLCGALITTICGSIAWQLVAGAFPIAFLSNPFTYIFLRICLALEATGIASGAWVLASIHKKIAHFQRDEVYVGTAEERAAKGHADDAEKLQLGAGHLAKLPAFAEDAPEPLKLLMMSDPSIAAYMKSIRGMDAEGETDGDEFVDIEKADTDGQSVEA